jgi:succinoglycan biosynthesis protein ExoA
MSLPFVSVIMPCRNEGRTIARSMASILAQDYPADRMEIIVADGMSGDDTRDVLANFGDPRIRVVDNPERVTPYALNRAIDAAHGDYIQRVDAHSVLAPDYVRKLVEFLEAHPTAWGAGGIKSFEAQAEGPFSRAICVVLSHRFGIGNSKFRTDGVADHKEEPVDAVFNCCWPRAVFERVGLFHEQLTRSQDIELSTRIREAGGELWLVPSAQTTYFARSNFSVYVRHNWLNGIWSLLPAAYLGGRLPVRWRHLVPLAFVASLGLTGLMALLVPMLRWLPLLPALPYALMNLGISLSVAWRERDWTLVGLLPLAFAGMHLAYGAGSVWGTLRVFAHWLRPTTPTQPRMTRNPQNI